MLQKDKYSLAFIFLCISLSFFIKLFLIDNFIYWQDEAYTNWFVSQSYQDLLFWVPTFDANPPFYYLLVKLWNALFSSAIQYSERYFSLILLLPIYYFAIQTVKILTKKRFIAVLSIVLFLSLSPILSWYAVEARVYMLMVLCYLMAIYALVRIVKNDSDSVKYWVLLSIATLALNWTHSTGAIQSLFIYSILSLHIFLIKKNEYKYLFCALIFVFIFSLPLAFMVLQQLQAWGESTWIEEPNLKSLYYLLRDNFILFNADKLTYSVLGENIFANTLITALKFFSILVIGLCVFLSFRNKKFVEGYLMLLTFGMPVIYFFISIVGPNILLSRALIGMQITFYLFMIVSLSSLTDSKIKIFLISAISVLLFVSNLNQTFFKNKEPWDKVFNYIEDNYVEGDKILVMPNEAYLPLAHYAAEKLIDLNIESIPSAFPALNVSNFYPAGMPSVPGVSEHDIPGITEMLNDTNGKIIVITRSEKLFDPHSLLFSTIKNNNRDKLEDLDFKNLNVYQFSVKRKL